MPSEAELEVAFESFMEERCMKPDARVGMRRLPLTTKWMMLLADNSMKAAPAGSGDESPSHWVSVLKEKKLTRKEMEHLKISLRGAGKSWLKAFAEEGGVTLMLELLGGTRGSLGDGVLSEVLAGLKLFMNNEYGLSVVVNTPSGIDCLVSALVSTDDLQRSQLVDLLAVICWVSDRGHELIVQAFASRRAAYQSLISSLNSSNLEVQTRVLTFLNALINAVPALEHRVMMRTAFFDLGLQDSLRRVSEAIDANRGDRWERVEKLSVQCELFSQVREADARETTMAGVDFSDVDSAFEFVKRSCAADGHSSALIDLLHLLAVLGAELEDGGDAVWDNVVYAVSVISQRVADGDQAGAALSYEQLKQLLSEKDRHDVVKRDNHLKELETQVEQQRRQLHDWTMKAEHEKDEWRTKEEEYKKTVRELKVKQEAADIDKVKKLQTELDDVKRQLQQAKDELNAAPRAAPSASIPAAPGAPDAPPMAPALDGSDIPAPPPLGAPDAPPMAPPMAPDAPPMAPPLAPAMGDAPSAPPLAPAMGAPDAPPMAPGLDVPPPPGPPGAPPMAPGAPSAPAVPSLPKKKNVKPAVPMKQFHWSTIPPSDIAHTLWKTHSDDGVQLDTRALEEQFCNVSTAKKPSAVQETDPQALMAAAMGGRAAGRKDVVELIDSKRSYAVNIGLARFKMTHAAIRDALFAMDEKTLDEEKLLSLDKIAPSSEEVEAVVDWSGEGELGQTEQFFRTVAEVPHVSSRIELFLFKLRFDAVVEDVDAQLRLCESVTGRLRSSESLMHLMELILKLGNYLNGGTAKGGAYGFRLDTINKLKMTKSQQDSQLTLLHFLITAVAQHSKYSAYRTAITELAADLHAATRIEQAALQADIAKIRQMHTRLKAELAACPQTSKDRFHRVMTDFESLLKLKAGSLCERLSALEREVQDTTRWYGEDALRMDDLFRTFDCFVQDWLEAELWMETRRLQHEKEQKLREEKERRDRDRAERQIASAVSSSPSKAVNRDQLVDSVMEQLNGSSSEELMKAVKLRRRQAAADGEAAAAEGGKDASFDPRKMTMGGKQGLVSALLGRQSGGEKGRQSAGEKGRQSGGQPAHAQLGFNLLKGK